MGANRRDFLRTAAMAGAAGLGGLAMGSRTAEAAMGKGPDELSIGENGGYATVELARPVTTLGVIQCRVRGVRVSKRLERIQLVEELEDLRGLLLVHLADGEPHVNDHVVPDLHIRHVGEADLFPDAPELDDALP